MASDASIIASAAKGGGTKIMETFALVSLVASSTELNTGTFPSTASNPPLPGVTPATIFVPYSIICLEWNVPSEPVIPWTITFEFLLTKIDMIFLNYLLLHQRLFLQRLSYHLQELYLIQTRIRFF